MTGEELPAPLVAGDVDLRGYEFMPLYGDRLFKSETWINASAEAKVAALRLWWHAYAHEVPAASVPNNDVLLADYAGYGVAVRAWQKIKPQVMHNFIRCSDGRLYHEHLSVWALDAWAKRVSDRQRKANWRNRHKDKNGDGTGTETGTVPVTERGQDGSVTVDRTGTDRTGTEGKKEEASLLVVGKPPTAPTCPPCPHDDIIAAYHELLPMNPKVREWHDARQKALRARWRQKFVDGKFHTPEQGVSWFRKFFGHVAKSKFLTGQAQPQVGRAHFVADLEWLVTQGNFAKVIEGKYTDAT